jgi:predicted O-linked N-acetylglucosamine transferase (SPINDLY family)
MSNKLRKFKRKSKYQKKTKQGQSSAEVFSKESVLQQAMDLHKAGRSSDAEDLYRKFLSEKPDHPYALYYCAMLLNERGRAKKAIKMIKRALVNKPDFPKALYYLGGIHVEHGKLDDAVSCFRQVTSLMPDFFFAHYDLGVVLGEQGELDEAIASYNQALKVKPDNYMALYNLGCALRDQGRLEESISIYRKALKVKPDAFESLYDQGSALQVQGSLDEAISIYRKALKVKPEDIKAHNSFIFTLYYMSDITQEEIYHESLLWSERFAQIKPGKHENDLRSDRRLRVGYVSPDFRMHSVFYFIEPVIKAHDREKVEVFCYANVEIQDQDQATRHLQALAEHWISIIGKSDEEIVTRIKKDKIDILVDLAGFTNNNSLTVFARKPAPIQVTWLGCPNTTGLQTMDYRLTDAIADPLDGEDRFYSEELIRLDHGFLCYNPFLSVPEVNPPPCIDHNHVTFGSFNNLTKVTPEVIRVWAGILHAVPDSQLLLKASQFADEQTMKRFKEMFASHDIAHERLVMLKRTPSNEEHLGLYSKVDIGLDTFPYNGTTTTCEALWMGVPVVTLVGERHAGRVGASILKRVGLENLVASNVDQYIELARSLAADRDRLQEMRLNMRDRMQKSNLMDSELFTNHLEEVYRGMWDKYCESMQH